MSEPWLLLSLQPQFAEKLLCGEKTAELRRVRPRLATVGRRVLFYSSSPVMAVSGGATIEAIEEAPRTALWSRIGKASGVTKSQFDAYFAGARSNVALLVTDVWRCSTPIPLATLRRRLPQFHPPQSYCYVSASDVLRLLGSESPDVLAVSSPTAAAPRADRAQGDRGT